mgnify:CR=1 FL=1
MAVYEILKIHYEICKKKISLILPYVILLWCDSRLADLWSMKKSIVEARIEYAYMIHFLNELNSVGCKVVQEICNASILHMSSLKIFD